MVTTPRGGGTHPWETRPIPQTLRAMAGTAVWFPSGDSQIFGLFPPPRPLDRVAGPSEFVGVDPAGYRQSVMQAPVFTASPRDSVRPLAAFERLMLADARPGHPMTFFLECEVEGPLSLERLGRAAEAAAFRHPQLRSRIAWRSGRPCWLPPDVEPVIEAASADAWRPIDLARESSLRLVVLPSSDADTDAAPISRADVRAATAPRHRVVMVAHHAALDGVAAGEFFGDLWACYDGREPPRFSTGRHRGNGSESVGSDLPRAGQPSLAASTWPFATFRPRPLAIIRPPDDAGGIPAAARLSDARPPFETVALDRERTMRLRSLAGPGGWSLNDLVVAAVMRAAGRWNARAGGRAGNVRITLPVSMRPIGSRGPARNELGYAFLDRTAEQCRDRHSLAAGLAEASRWIVQTGAAGGFLAAAEVLARRPWLLRAVTRLPACFSTAVVSTIGDPARRMKAGVPRVDGLEAPGDLVIRAIRGVPPLRPGTRAAVGATTYGGELTLCCLCSAVPGERPSPTAATEFLTLVSEELTGFL